MRIVAALGGNALLRRNEPADVSHQRRNVRAAVAATAELAREHELVITHGDGPQVGLLALQAESDPTLAAYPLDVLGAESDGMIGYLLEQELTNALPGRRVATLLTQVIVGREDPAFAHPSKPIGPAYDRATAERLAAERGWSIARDGAYYRRVVPSPEPRAIVELATLRLLVDAGVLVICVGGGGIPVLVDGGRLRGSRRSSTRISPRRSWPGPSTPMRCCCSRTSTPSTAGGARRARDRCTACRAPSYAEWPSTRARWGPRSTPPAASRRPPAVSPRSDRWATPPGSCAVSAGRG
jgi:hypothetical protein